MELSCPGWDVYLSYDPDVAERVQPLTDMLRARGVSVPPTQVAAPARYGGGLAQTIQHSKALVLVLTQDSCGSNWTRLDLALALELDKPVLGVLLDSPSDTELPDGLSADHCLFWSASDPGTTMAIGQALAEVTGGAVANLAPESPAAGAAPVAFRAYHGEDASPDDVRPYVFVSYAHLDGEEVYADIGRLHNEGFRIWYDEGIRGGEDFAEKLASMIEEAAQFLLFITPRSVRSRFVKSEIRWAIQSDVPIVPIWLEESVLPKGIDFVLGQIHAIARFRMEVEQYFEALRGSLLPETRRETFAEGTPCSMVSPTPAAPVPERRGIELQLSYLLAWSVDGGDSWQPLDVSRESSTVPADALLRAMVLSSVPCRAALLVETDEPGEAGPATSVFFADPKDAPAAPSDWRVIPPLRWHPLPRAQALRERTPEIRRWRVGVLALAGQEADGEALPRDPRLAVEAAQRGRAAAPCMVEAMGRIQRTRFKLRGDAVPVSVLRGDDTVVYWTEVRFG